MARFFDNFNSANRIARDPIEFAAREILETYGHSVRISREGLHRFGRNTQLGTTEEALNYLGIVPLRSSTNSITHFSSSNAADTQTLTVEGLTISSNVLTAVTQTITLVGQTKTALTTPLSRVTRIANDATPSTATAGDVYVYEDGTITAGVPDNLATVGNVMPAGDQTTVFAGFSTANNQYLALTELFAYINKQTTASADVRLKIRPVGGVYRTVSVRDTSNTSGVEAIFLPFILIPPNHDIDVTADSSAINTDVSAGFSGFFADII